MVNSLGFFFGRYFGKNIVHLPAVPTIRVPNICDKFHFRWPERVVFGKCQMSFKHTTFTVNSKKNKQKTNYFSRAILSKHLNP